MFRVSARRLHGEKLLERLREVGAVLDGHFLLTSGKHSPVFIQCSQALQYPADAERIAKTLAARFAALEPTVVAGPAMGGVILAHEVARALGVRSSFTEKQNGSQVFRRGFRLTDEDRVLLVEDVLTTGGSVLRSAAAVKAAGAAIVGVGLIIDRTAGKAAEALGLGPGVEVRALAFMDAPGYPPDQCPMCRDGVPLVRPKEQDPVG
ncbi:MAG: orotate phosphoribosyltransferase [Bacillota bacterium]|nr:MAG: orotate phosphoribosyltransferase [Bacillota bacterium]